MVVKLPSKPHLLTKKVKQGITGSLAASFLHVAQEVEMCLRPVCDCEGDCSREATPEAEKTQRLKGVRSAECS